MTATSLAGPYDRLYSASPDNILWDSTPSHLMLKLNGLLATGNVLDAGCGDGVNALFLERSGYSVRGLDVSKLALNGLRIRFGSEHVQPVGRYSQADLHHWRGDGVRYNALVSCGLFQCLSKETRHIVHSRLQSFLTEEGIVLFSCLTNTIPLPQNHQTPGLELADVSEVRDLFSGMRIEYFREGVIEDRHGTIVDRHEHSVVWVVARGAT